MSRNDFEIYEYKGEQYSELYPYMAIALLLDELLEDEILFYDEAKEEYFKSNGHSITNNIDDQSILDYFMKLGDLDGIVYEFRESEVTFIQDNYYEVDCPYDETKGV